MRLSRCLCLAVTVACGLSLLAEAAQKGLVAHWDFSEGKGDVLHDRSGNSNHGTIHGARWVKGPWGTGLEFDGKDDYVDCGASDSLNIASGGTVMLWCRAETPRGGLVNWSTGSGWNDERLVLGMNTYSGDGHTNGYMSHGSATAHAFCDFGRLARGEWVHLAFAYDGRNIWSYRDGLLIVAASQTMKPNIEGVPMWIGRCSGLGRDYFHGMISDVRIYNRALSEKEILGHYRAEAPRRNKDMSVFKRVVVSAQAYPGPGRITVKLDARGMAPLPAGSRIHVALLRHGSRRSVKEVVIRVRPGLSVPQVMFDVQKEPAGTYVVRAGVLGPDDAAIGKQSSVTVSWTRQPAAFKNINVLNNLCWELLNRAGDAKIGNTQTFTLPIDRWILLRTTADVPPGAEVRVTVAGDATPQPAVVHRKSGTLEAMRYLKAGTHTLHVSRKGKTALTRMIVRAIPALHYAFYDRQPHIAPHGPYDWAFLAKDIRPNVNVMINSGPKLDRERIKEWKETGRSWILRVASLWQRVKRNDENAVAKVYNYWTSTPGFQDPLLDGIISDEFSGWAHPAYHAYREVVERIHGNPDFSGKTVLPYGGQFFVKKAPGTQFAQACLAGGGYVCPERYLNEKPSEEEARQRIAQQITHNMPHWERGMPGVTQRLIWVLGCMSQPTESLNINPSVDFKVHMDMQIRTLATNPAFFALGGIQEYHSAYADEETVRWTGRLYRHYCIEGNTSPATDDPYKLTHIQNPDFLDGTDGWTIRSAEAAGVRVKQHKGYGWLQGRFTGSGLGDRFLLMRRSVKGPNTFSQEIKNLQPGRLYSMKMITADYENLVQEKSEKKQDAVSIKLDNVDILPGAKSNFQFTFPNCYAHHLGKFNAKHNYWMNYHWRVFRARGTTAKLTISDWAGEKTPGGPAGQEIMFNFIEIQPYLAD